MSSNQYGFTCWINWSGRSYEVEVVYEDTHDDSEASLLAATATWESEVPADLAAYELAHRDWSTPRLDGVRIALASCCGGWLATDSADDPTWSPPQPTEREVFEIIAAGNAQKVKHGWDT